MAMTKVGVIGVGHLGYHHARVYSQLPGVILVGVSDTNERQLEKAAADFATEGFPNYEQLLDEADAVSVGRQRTDRKTYMCGPGSRQRAGRAREQETAYFTGWTRRAVQWSGQKAR